MAEKSSEDESPKDVVMKETTQTPASTQQTDSSPATFPSLESHTDDSLMTRFLTNAIFNLTPPAPLQPKSPTEPRSLSRSLKDGSDTPKSISTTPAALRTQSKTRSPFSLVSQKRVFDFKSSQQSIDSTPSAKRLTSWSREKEQTPCPDGTKSRSTNERGWDHWSPGSNSRQELFPGGSKSYKAVDSGVLSRKDGDCSLRRKYMETKEDPKNLFRFNKEGRSERKPEGKKDIRKETKKENLQVLPPQAVEPSPRQQKFPSLLSIGILGKAVRDEKEIGGLCYSCGKMGHSFVDCLVKCGHCDLDGHKTMNCKLVHPRAKVAAKEA